MIKAVPADHPHRRTITRLERSATDAIAEALDNLRRDLFRGISRDNVREIVSRLSDPEINERLRLALYDALLPAVDAGFENGQTFVNETALGVKRGVTEIGFDWELVHELAREWLRQHTFSLTYANVWSITTATAARLRGAIDDFIASPDMTMNQLTRLVEGIFDPIRAELIAVTEVTRTFAQSELTAWRESGIIKRKRWNTARDELVCPICGPLHRTVADMDGTFPGGFDGPPAHPRCRCWVSGVVEVPDG